MNKTHGARWLASRLERNRIEPRVRRMLGKLQAALHANPWEELRALTIGRLARRELLIQQREQHLLANPTADGDKWLIGLWNAQRRDAEALALLERMVGDHNDDTLTCRHCGKSFASLTDYGTHGCFTAPPKALPTITTDAPAPASAANPAPTAPTTEDAE